MALMFAPMASFYALFLAVPYAYIFWLSFTKYSSTTLFIPEYTIQNYIAVLTDSYYLGLFARTIGLGVFVTCLSLVMCYPLAMMIVASSRRLKSALLVTVITPLLVNVVIRTYTWIVLLGDNGIVNRSLARVGLIDSPLPINGNFVSVALGLVHLSIPLMTLSLVSVMEKLDKGLIEASQSLGASQLRSLLKIHFPLCRAGVGTGSLLVFCTVVSAFVTPQLLGGNKFSTVSTVIYDKFTVSLNWPIGATLVFLLLSINLVVILFHGLVFKDR